jgi:predicted secreted protein
MNDRTVTKREVAKLIVPHLSEASTDEFYLKRVSELAAGSTKTGDAFVRSTAGAKSLLKDELAKMGRVQIGEADNGKTINVRAGKDVALTLLGNATTGYQWKVVSTNRTFGYPTEKYIPNNPSGIGAGGASQFVWKTSSGILGKHKVVLEYVRPFDPAHPEKTFSVTINVVK